MNCASPALAEYLPWALQDAHEKGVIHRNVKPSNILLIGEQGNWECKLLDFGTGKLSEGCRKSKAGYVRASADPHYMSPEQCAGKKMDARSDIYSLGCALFEAITAQPPYSAEDTESIRKMHFNDPLPTLREASLGREFPQLLEGIVHTMLAKEPQHRYSSASQVAENLMRLKLSSQLKIKVLPKNRPPRISQNNIIALLCLTSIIGMGLAIIFWMQLRQPIGTEPLEVPVLSPLEPPFSESLTAEDINAIPTIENVNVFTPDRSTKTFFKKSRTVDGIEFREYEFPAIKVGSLKDPKSGVIEAVGKQEVAWSGPWVFQAADSLFQNCPTVLKRFRDDEIRAIDFASNVNPTQFQALQKYKKLDELSFEASRFDDSHLKQIMRLPNLKILSLRRTNVTAAGLSCSPGLGQLRKLSLEGMPNVILVLHALQKSGNLEELQLRNCPGLTEEHYRAIAAIPNLKRLSINRFGKLDPSMFDALTSSKSLEELDIQETELSEADFEGLAKLQRLKKFAHQRSKSSYYGRLYMKKLMPMTAVEWYADLKAYWNGY